MPGAKETSHSPSGDAKASTTSAPLNSQPVNSEDWSREIKCISCDTLINRRGSAHHIAPERAGFEALADLYTEKLSPVAKKLAALPIVRLLDDIPNCAAAWTRPYALADHDRGTHSLHTAAKVHELNPHVKGKLTPKELQVLECAALLHDIGHRRGSHALDRVLAAHPGAPDIKDWGWDTEFHEYHGARIVAKNDDIKRVLGGLHADVLAVLCKADKRPERGEIAAFEKDFGTVKPTLPKDRIGLLSELVEKILDRNSCLELDYIRGGLAGGYVKLMHELVQKFESALTIHRGQLTLRVDNTPNAESRDGWISERDFHDYISCRQLFREIVATTPGSCNVDVHLRKAVWAGLRADPAAAAQSDTVNFGHLRNKILKGDYESMFGKDFLKMIEEAPHDPKLLSVEDISAPLVTMTKDDFSDTSKLCTVDAKRAEEACGEPRTDMSEFEYELLTHLKKNGVKADVWVVVTNDFEKILNYNALLPGKAIAEVTRFAVHSSYKAVKVVVAARAIDTNGKPINLGRAQEIAERFCRGCSYLKKDALATYDRHIFVRPVTPQSTIQRVREELLPLMEKPSTHISEFESRLLLNSSTSALEFFTPEVQERLKQPRLEWERLNKHGLKPSVLAFV